MKTMKFLLPTLALTLLCTTSFAAINAKPQLDTNTAKLSYAMGFKTGQAMKARDVSINTNDFSQGLSDGYNVKTPAMTEQQMQTVLTNMQKKMVNKMQQKYTEVANTNLKEGEAFLAKNAKEAGVITLPSGLQYKILTPGKGAMPTANETVTVNYEGKLIDGQIFDSSYQRHQPATFKVGQVIQGWQQALQLMQPGATWMLYIPSNLAYGKQGSMGAIGPNETLIFKVDLLSVKK